MSSEKSIEAVFIRHGQSAANVGPADYGFSEIPLTRLGWEQAEALAASWKFKPSYILVSPFLRAQQTAEATRARFPDVPVETWPIHEFTFWDRACWGGNTPEPEFEEVARYWERGDPDFRYGEKAESFGEFLERTRTALARLQRMEVSAPVLLFSHGHFMQAMRLDLNHPEWSDRRKMSEFLSVDAEHRVMNAERITVRFDGSAWRVTGDEVALAAFEHPV